MLLVMLNNCISSKYFKETRSIYSASIPLERFMGSDTDDNIDELFTTVSERSQEAKETSNKKGSNKDEKDVFSML